MGNGSQAPALVQLGGTNEANSSNPDHERDAGVGVCASGRHPRRCPEAGACTRTNACAQRERGVESVAQKLGTTPDALETEYLAARQANPKLTHGQFVAANMVAHNLSAKNPNITTQAILDGLKSGKSVGQTLQSLGLSGKEAKEAEATAKREAKQAEHDADKAEKAGGQ